MGTQTKGASSGSILLYQSAAMFGGRRGRGEGSSMCRHVGRQARVRCRRRRGTPSPARRRRGTTQVWGGSGVDACLVELRALAHRFAVQLLACLETAGVNQTAPCIPERAAVAPTGPVALLTSQISRRGTPASCSASAASRAPRSRAVPSGGKPSSAVLPEGRGGVPGEQGAVAATEWISRCVCHLLVRAAQQCMPLEQLTSASQDGWRLVDLTNLKSAEAGRRHAGGRRGA